MKRELEFQLSLFKICIISAFVAIPTYSRGDIGDTFTFDPSFLSPGMAKKTDLSRFEKGANALPGSYPVTIIVNQNTLGDEIITFRDNGDGIVDLCLLPSTIRRINFNYSELSTTALLLIKKADDSCIPIKDIAPGITIDFDSGAQRLNLNIPQAYLNNKNNGYVSPEYWDEGVSALLLGYQSNYYSMSSHGTRTDSAYLGLNTGFNIGAWRLRHNGNYNWMQDTGGSYQRINTYAERDIPSIGGRFIAGENNSGGNVFDTLPYRGIELRDEERMLPQSERGYAPAIRGIARTNAKVTIRQNGQIIRETTVPPGAFNIDDLYPNGYGGELDVTVTEADGSVQRFSVPYASVSQLLRPGSHHYNVIIGEFNDTRTSRRRPLYQATYQRGLSNMFTGYGGLQSSNDDYYALQIGTALNTPLGALALDVSQARTHLNGNTAKDTAMSGQSYRVSYSKFVPETRSNFSVAAYRYSTSGYLDYRTAMLTMDEVANGRSPETIYRPKNRFTTTLNQGLPGVYGQFYITGYTQDYWNAGAGSDLQYQLGYNNNFRSVAYGINAGRTRNGLGNMETTFMFNISMPLGGAGVANTPNLTAALSRDSSGHYGQQVGISGTAGQEHEYSYGATASHYNNGAGSSGNLNGQYRSPLTNLSASVSKGSGYTSASAGASGTLIAWSGGVVATPYSGDTFAVVEAQGATGAAVGGYTGVKVDSFGHAAVPYLNPYEMNEVALDPKGIPASIELENTSQRVAPYAGAVVRLKYETRSGYPLLIRLNTRGTTVPFGAEVIDTKGNSVGMVGQGGEVYARVEAQADILRVQWGPEAGAQCNIRYRLTATQMEDAGTALLPLSAICTN